MRLHYIENHQLLYGSINHKLVVITRLFPSLSPSSRRRPSLAPGIRQVRLQDGRLVVFMEFKLIN